MLLEDEEDLCDMILAMCDILGVTGVAFSTGGAAMEWIADVEKGDYLRELPELALLDIRLPDAIDGTMVAKRLRQSRPLRNMVIVMMTAFYLSAGDEQAILDAAEADYLLYKPLPRFDQFSRLLEDLIAQNHSEV